MGRVKKEIESMQPKGTATTQERGVITAFAWELDNLGDYTERVMNRILYKIGGYTMKVMRGELSVSDPPFSKKRPPKYTKGKRRLTAAYQRWLKERHKYHGRNRPRPPYKRVGTLAKLVAFEVVENESTVYVGPRLFKHNAFRSNKPLPELLDTGGTAKVRIQQVDGTMKWQSRKWNKFEYVRPSLKRASAQVEAIIARETA